MGDPLAALACPRCRCIAANFLMAGCAVSQTWIRAYAAGGDADMAAGKLSSVRWVWTWLQKAAVTFKTCKVCTHSTQVPGSFNSHNTSHTTGERNMQQASSKFAMKKMRKDAKKSKRCKNGKLCINSFRSPPGLNTFPLERA